MRLGIVLKQGISARHLPQPPPYHVEILVRQSANAPSLASKAVSLKVFEAFADPPE